MLSFRETRACLAYPTRNKFINEQKFAPLYDVHMLTYPKFPCWNYERFDLGEKTKSECLSFVSTARAFMKLLSRGSYLTSQPFTMA